MGGVRAEEIVDQTVTVIRSTLRQGSPQVRASMRLAMPRRLPPEAWAFAQVHTRTGLSC